jgi:type IV pilus assembly protein PilP
VRTLAVVLAVSLMVTLMGCGGGSVEDGSPKVSDLKAERDRVAAKVKKRKGQKQKKAQLAKKAQVEPESQLDASFGQASADFVYEVRNRRDPFRSTFWSKPAKQAPRGPLEQYELGQLSVSAIVWETDRPRALVTDPGGMAYVVKEGSRVGKNDGLVIHIGDNLVLVKETYIDFAGEQSTKDVEMKIRMSQGG